MPRRKFRRSQSNYTINRGLAKRYFWLYSEDEYEGTYRTQRYPKLIPDSKREARMMTMDFIAGRLKKGYTAEEIVTAIQSKGNFKNNVSVRVRTYKDPDRENGLLYSVID